MTAFKIKDIRPNPFRNLAHYPIRRDKIDRLRESVRTTGFWDNVVARLGDDGYPQIAYGHHRLQALREEYPPDHEVDLIIRDLDNDQMLKIMARENMDEWASNAMIEMETVKATLDAYALGLIKDLPPVKEGTPPVHIKHTRKGAGGQVEKPYTAPMLAEYLGWMVKGQGDKPDYPDSDKVNSALRGLKLIDTGNANIEDFESFGSRTVKVIARHADKAEPEQVKEIIRTAQKVTEDGGGHAAVNDQLMRQGSIPQPKRVTPLSKDLNTSLLRDAAQIEKMLDNYDPVARRIHNAMTRKKEIKPETIKRLDKVLLMLRKRAQEIRRLLEN